MSKVYFVTDTETTGPSFATHNMYQMATVPVLADGTVLHGMSCNLAFSTEQHDPDTLDFLKRDLGFTPEQWMQRNDLVIPEMAMVRLETFVENILADHGAKKPIFVADNLAFDWGFVHTYFHHYRSKNPFGYAGRNIPCLSLGLYGSRDAWEEFRSEAHSHNALEDTRGNAGAFAKMIQDGLKIS
jgi:hypothetical protein